MIKRHKEKEKKIFGSKCGTYLSPYPKILSWEVLLSACAKKNPKQRLAVQRGYSVLTVPPLGFEGLSETLIMFNYLWSCSLCLLPCFMV